MFLSLNINRVNPKVLSYICNVSYLADRNIIGRKVEEQCKRREKGCIYQRDELGHKIRSDTAGLFQDECHSITEVPWGR